MVQGQEATEKRLLGILYRFDCPSPLTIGEYAMDLWQSRHALSFACTCSSASCALRS